jgi:hypothetical protein
MTMHARPCPACPGGSTGRQARRAAPPASCGRSAARRACLPVDYLDKPARQVRGLRSGVNNQMAQSAWVAMTHETAERQSAKSAGPCVDAGVTELSEMTIGRTDDPENPLLATAGQPGRVIVWGWIAEPIWASGRAAAPTGRTHDRNRTARQISSTLLLHPRGRPHMRVPTGWRADPPCMELAQRPGSPRHGGGAGITACFSLVAKRSPGLSRCFHSKSKILWRWRRDRP